MIHTLYDNKTGLITGQTSDPHRIQFETNIAGNYNGSMYYIKQARAKKYPPKPARAFWHRYDWDNMSETWQLNIPETERAARLHRNNLFRYVDKISPIWYAAMTEQERMTCIEFRQQLLDITSASDFPVNIQWPSVPEFLRT
jgi:hypothetical protein